MTRFTFEYLNIYANHGQNAEQSIRYKLTGKIAKADNLAYNLGADCLNYQIKSARATVCKGIDLKTYLDADAATAYIYATKDGTAYIMSRIEYEAFCYKFATPTTESVKNGGSPKLRLKSESVELLEWLRMRA